MTSAKRLIRQRGAVYDTREAALADGWPEAEYGWWVPANGDLALARWGWIALAGEGNPRQSSRCSSE
jgi:hypothetical protein